MEIGTLCAISLYFIILVSIGLSAYRTQQNAADFLLGGRSLNYYVTAISAHASDMSTWLFMGFPAAIYTKGLIEFWSAIGLILGMFLTWHYIAPRLRIETEHYHALTLSSYFAARFHDRYGLIRFTTALMSLVFFTFYVTANIQGMGIVSQQAFGISSSTGIFISTCAVVLYTILGGFLAVAWTDLFQGLFLLVMLLFVPTYAYSISGSSWSSIAAIAQAHHVSLSLMPEITAFNILVAMKIAASWGLGYFGQPHVLSKFMGIKQVNEMSKAKRIGMTWHILSLTAATCVGLVGLSFFKHTLADPQLIFITMVKALFSPFAASFILCSILAASISTIDSQILVFASVFSEDIYKKLLNPTASARQVLRVSRLGILIIALLGYIIASYETRGIYDIVKYAWSGLGSSFGPLLIVALYSKKVTSPGALAGIVAGGLTSGLWPHLRLPLPYDSIIPGFIASFVAIFVVSALTQPTTRSLQN